jgi:hypothetical protein
MYPSQDVFVRYNLKPELDKCTEPSNGVEALK